MGVDFIVYVAAEDGYETIEGFLGGGGGCIDCTISSGVCES